MNRKLRLYKTKYSTKNKKISDTFNSYFESVTDSLDLFNWLHVSADKINDIIKNMINGFRDYPQHT